MSNTGDSISALLEAARQAVNKYKAEVSSLEEQAQSNANNASIQASLTAARDHLRDWERQSDALQNMSVHTPNQADVSHGPAMANASYPPVVYRQSLLKAPKPFALGADFDVFTEKLLDYVKEHAFEEQIQVLRALLTPEAYKAGRNVIKDARHTSLKSVLNALKDVLAPKQSLSLRIDAFHKCEQKHSESLEQFLGRLRCAGEEAFPSMPDLEPYILQQFISGIRASNDHKMLLRAQRLQSVSQALSLATEITAAASTMSVDMNTEVHEVQTQSDYHGSRPFCSYCKKVGHFAANCFRKSICQICQLTGHTAQRCRTKVVCQLCGKPSHVATQCRSVRFTVPKTREP